MHKQKKKKTKSHTNCNMFCKRDREQSYIQHAIVATPISSNATTINITKVQKSSIINQPPSKTCKQNCLIVLF